MAQPSSPSLPPEVATVARRLARDVPALAIEMRDAILAEQASYADIGSVPLEDLTSSCEDHLAFTLGELGGTHRDTRSARGVGRRRADQGVPLEAMLHAYRVGARFLATRLLEELSDSLLRSEFVLATVQASWDMLEDYTRVVTASYLEAVGERTRRNAEIRSATLAELLAGRRSEGPQLLDAARMLDLPPQGTFLVATVIDASQKGRDVGQRLTAANIVSVWHRGMDSDTGVVVVPAGRQPESVLRRLQPQGAERIGVSSPYTGLHGSSTAARESRLAADAADPGGVVRYDTAPVPVLLARTPEGTDQVVASVLGGLLALPERDRDTLLDTLRTWFDQAGSVTGTAEALFVHRNTVGHRAQQIAALTGRSLSSPREAAELYLALEAHRLGGLRRG